MSGHAPRMGSFVRHPSPATQLAVRNLPAGSKGAVRATGGGVHLHDRNPYDPARRFLRTPLRSFNSSGGGVSL